jgi:hypothetical protein
MCRRLNRPRSNGVHNNKNMGLTQPKKLAFSISSVSCGLIPLLVVVYSPSFITSPLIVSAKDGVGVEYPLHWWSTAACTC